MNFSNLRNEKSFLWISRFLLAILSLVFVYENYQYARVIKNHLLANRHDLKLLVSPRPDELTMQADERLKQIREMKLNPATAVTYFGDEKLKTKSEYDRDYFLARYALAPVMVKVDEKLDTAVGDFSITRSINHPMNPLAGDTLWAVASDNGKGALLLVKKKNR